MRYLDKEDTNYALGVRAIHEFEGYLRQNMPDTIEECCLCKQIVFRVSSYLLKFYYLMFFFMIRYLEKYELFFQVHLVM